VDDDEDVEAVREKERLLSVGQLLAERALHCAAFPSMSTCSNISSANASDVNSMYALSYRKYFEGLKKAEEAIYRQNSEATSASTAAPIGLGAASQVSGQASEGSDTPQADTSEDECGSTRATTRLRGGAKSRTRARLYVSSDDEDEDEDEDQQSSDDDEKPKCSQNDLRGGRPPLPLGRSKWMDDKAEGGHRRITASSTPLATDRKQRNGGDLEDDDGELFGGIGTCTECRSSGLNTPLASTSNGVHGTSAIVASAPTPHSQPESDWFVLGSDLGSSYLRCLVRRRRLIRFVVDGLCGEDGAFENGGCLQAPCTAMAVDLMPMLGRMAQAEAALDDRRRAIRDGDMACGDSAGWSSAGSQGSRSSRRSSRSARKQLPRFDHLAANTLLPEPLLEALLTYGFIEGDSYRSRDVLLDA
jgi:hypothetical protein